MNNNTKINWKGFSVNSRFALQNENLYPILNLFNLCKKTFKLDFPCVIISICTFKGDLYEQ
jgi:hypothetical protein